MAKKRNLEKYDAFLVDLIKHCNQGQPFKASELIQVHGVDHYSIVGLMNLGHVTTKSEGRQNYYNFNYLNTDAEKIVDMLDKELTRMRAFKKAFDEPQSAPPEKSVNLSNSVDNILAVTDIGMKYGIPRDQIKEFVKDILVLKLSTIK